MILTSVLVFDFDNVIVRGSEELKQDAFRDLFKANSDESRKLKDAIDDVRDAKGDRYSVLQHVFASSDNKEKNIHATATRYEERARELICDRSVHPDDARALFVLGRHAKLHIVSNTPEDILQGYIKFFDTIYPGFRKLFGLVLGTPKDKPQNLKTIRNHEHCIFHYMTLIGDGENDRLAAEETGVHFLGVTTIDNRKKWYTLPFQKVRYISELPQLFGLN